MNGLKPLKVYLQNYKITEENKKYFFMQKIFKHSREWRNIVTNKIDKFLTREK